MRSWRNRLGLLGIGTLAVSACADIDTSRTIPQRGTIGEEVYGIFCDRIAADATALSLRLRRVPVVRVAVCGPRRGNAASP